MAAENGEELWAADGRLKDVARAGAGFTKKRNL
jgi:hypothetical protein